jgi:hypothetical protein
MTRYAVDLRVHLDCDDAQQARELLEAFTLSIAPCPQVLAIDCTPPPERPVVASGRHLEVVS